MIFLGLTHKVLAKVIVLDLAQITAGDVKVIQEQLLSLKIALLSKKPPDFCVISCGFHL
jgi:hypothetical protein